MMMVEVNSIDSIPGEAELLAYAANYMAARLFTPRQRKYLNVLIDVTKEPLRVPVTRAMLGPQKSSLGTKAPTLFEMTVSTAFGIRDAAETIAHEMLHISQAVNERLLITRKKTKVAGRKTAVDMARWMGGKPVVIDNLAWHLADGRDPFIADAGRGRLTAIMDLARRRARGDLVPIPWCERLERRQHAVVIDGVCCKFGIRILIGPESFIGIQNFDLAALLEDRKEAVLRRLGG